MSVLFSSQKEINRNGDCKNKNTALDGKQRQNENHTCLENVILENLLLEGGNTSMCTFSFTEFVKALVKICGTF